MRLVLDTDVVIASLRSPAGASAELIRLAVSHRLTLLASVPLAFEYEAVATRESLLRATGMTLGQAVQRISTIIGLCEPVYLDYSWRPQLRDPNDEMILETAVNGQADGLVSFNIRDYKNAPDSFGIQLCRPGEILKRIK
jgi:putative PIN family toxin of toxin-antitoxin system